MSVTEMNRDPCNYKKEIKHFEKRGESDNISTEASPRGSANYQ